MDEFWQKHAKIQAMQTALLEGVRDLLPVEAPLVWQLANSPAETGLVVGHWSDGRVRVRDDRMGFHTTITISDILRAKR